MSELIIVVLSQGAVQAGQRTALGTTLGITAITFAVPAPASGAPTLHLVIPAGAAAEQAIVTLAFDTATSLTTPVEQLQRPASTPSQAAAAAAPVIAPAAVAISLPQPRMPGWLAARTRLNARRLGRTPPRVARPKPVAKAVRTAQASRRGPAAAKTRRRVVWLAARY